MRSRLWILFLFGLPLLVPASARAQNPWSGILVPSRATDWSKAGVQGGIPTYKTVCATVNPSGDKTGATDGVAINNALKSCAAKVSAASPQVVALAMGTFYSNIGIGAPSGTSYLVLRGAGPDKTILKFVGSSSQCGRPNVDICIGTDATPSDQYGGGTTSWLGTNDSIGTYTQGAHVLDVASTSGFSAGQPIHLNQRNDSMGLCPQSGGTGDCSGITGLTNNGSGTVTAVTSAPYPAITAGASVYVGTNNNHSVDGSCGGYQSGPTPWTVLSATTTSKNTTFTYSDSHTLSAPTSNCEPIFASVDTGGLFTCNVNAACTVSNAFAGLVCPDSVTGNQCAPGEISQRSQDEIHTIKAICTGAATPIAACLAASEIVIYGQVLAPNYRSSQAPGAWWPSSHAQYDGLENLTVDATNDGNAQFSVELFNTVNSWVRNIRTVHSYSVAVGLQDDNHVAVVDSYLYGSKHSGPNSYGVDMIDATNALIQNNILQHIVAGVVNEQGYGDVISYNYAFDEHSVASSTMLNMIDLNHGFAGDVLSEGNDTNSFDTDNGHGTSWGITYFRSRSRGQDTPPRPANTGLYTITDPAFERVQNIIGNVLGTPGFQSTYVQDTPNSGYPSEGIYWLATSGYVENGPKLQFPLDTATLNTLLRWGNYDVVTGAVRWCGNSSDPGWTTTCSSTSEVPTTGVTYINGNPVPSSTTLPASFYLSAQPTWWQTAWGTPPWPAIGPGITCGTGLDCDTPPDGIGGYSYYIPAQLCYEHTPIDPAYQQTFTVTGASVSAGTDGYTSDVTLTIGTNSLQAVDTIVVGGMNPSSFDGTYQVLSETSTTITYGMNSKPGSYVSGGTVGWPNILLFNAAHCYPAAYGTPNAVTLSATSH